MSSIVVPRDVGGSPARPASAAPARAPSGRVDKRGVGTGHGSPRSWSTRAGELELATPRLRTGSYFPSFLEPRKRSERALVPVV